MPTEVETPPFRLVPLTIDLAEQDYEAVMASAEHLRRRFGGEWPPDEFTLEQDREELRMHEQQFARREAFAYAILAFDEGRLLGSVYVVPADADTVDAAVVYWLRDGAAHLYPVLRERLEEWMREAWPFEHVAYPLREPGGDR